MSSEWYLTALPGLAIVLTLLSINIIGDRLTDILNRQIVEPSPKNPTKSV